MPDVHSLLFDPVSSQLPLLNVNDKAVMDKIYRDNGSGWIKIGVVRDPVTRLLSAYLDLVQTWSDKETRTASEYYGPDQPHRGLEIDDDWEWIDVIRRHRGLTEDDFQQQNRLDAEERRSPISTGGEKNKRKRGGESGHRSRQLRDDTSSNAPSFEEMLKMLEVHSWAAPAAFRPAARTCGMGQSPFDSIIPFETLQVCIEKLEAMLHV